MKMMYVGLAMMLWIPFACLKLLAVALDDGRPDDSCMRGGQ